MSTFDKLSAINVNERTEKKQGLTYLSWAWAWAEFSKACPDATYEVWRDVDGNPFTYSATLGYMVYVSVITDGVTHTMWLPVMDGANKAQRDEDYEYEVRSGTKHCKAATMFDINTAIMRCLVKCLAMFGLGLYIYSGEDLPEASKEEAELKKYKFGILKEWGDIDPLIVKECFSSVEGVETELDGRKGLAEMIRAVGSKERLENIGKHIAKMAKVVAK